MDNIYFSTRDELTKVNIADVMYIQADGNYAVVHFKSGRRTSLLASLQSMWQLLESSYPGKFVFTGRSHIVNIQYVCQLNSIHKTILVADDNTKEHALLHVSKGSIVTLREIINKEIVADISDFRTKNGSMKASTSNDS